MVKEKETPVIETEAKAEPKKKTTRKKAPKSSKVENQEYNPFQLDIPEDFNIAKNLIKIDSVDKMGNPKSDLYMTVMSRLCWFKGNHEDYPIITEFLNVVDNVVLFKATVYDNEGKILACAHGAETMRRVINGSAELPALAYQKAETQAIGRALRFLGYGASSKDVGDEDQPIDEAPTTTEIVTPFIASTTASSVIDTKEKAATEAPVGSKEPTHAAFAPTSTSGTTFLKTEVEKQELAEKVLTSPFPFKIDGCQSLPTYEVLMKANKDANLHKKIFEGDGCLISWALKNLPEENKKRKYTEALKELIEDKEFYYKVIQEFVEKLGA